MIRFRKDDWGNSKWKGIEIRRPNKRVWTLIEITDEWSVRHGITVDINSIDDGVHGNPTFHGFGAIDFDTDGDNAEDLQSLFNWLMFMSPPEYDIVHKGDHIHTEYDPKIRNFKPWGKAR
jgi:hypothetical protein